MKDESSSIQIGQRVRGEVYKILPYAVLVRFHGKLHGIIRQREMSWEDDRLDPEKLFKVGEIIEAVVLKISDEENSIELSLRVAQKDPWDDYIKTHGVGDVVSGVVRGVREFGAFVEIAKGVEGFIPVSEIRHGERVEKAQDVLWVGDEIVAVLQEINHQRRQLRLSIKAYLETHLLPHSKRPEEHQSSLQDFLEPVVARRLRQAMGDIPEETIWPEPGRIQRVLIADDHQKFRESLAQTLRDWGYFVLEAKNFHAVREAMNAELDLAILDFHLSDGSTIALAKEIVKKQEHISVLLLTGFEIDESEIEEARSHGFHVEYKPFGPADLLEYLQNLEKRESRSDVKLSGTETNGVEFLSGRAQERRNEDVQIFLERLVAESGATGAILFRESLEKQGEIEWPYVINLEISDPEAHITFQFSPVRDVLHNRTLFEIQDALEHPGRSKYLSRAIPFRSCVGIPVPVSNSSSSHSLFLFSNNPGVFSKSDPDWWIQQGELLGHQIEREQIASLFIATQGELLRSQLRAGALHEVRNSLGGLEHVLDSLLRRIMEMDAALAFQPRTLESFRSSVLEAQAFTGQMKKTAELFRELGLSTKFELTSINDIVRRSVERQLPLADHLTVYLDFKPDNNLPAMLLRPAHLQQAVENVILNAIQWCADRRARRVNVSTVYRTDDNDFPIQIRVADTGPGIHRQLQNQRIFEMGYSMRQGGSGLGLFVSRILLQSMNGKIKVEKSVMEVGTTFVIELPLSLVPIS